MLKFGRRKSKQNAARQAAQTGMSAADLAVFQKILHEKSGIVLSDSKRALVESRVTQRLRALGMNSFSSYLHYLSQDASGDELVQLIDVISTNITNFYREPDHFQLLDDTLNEWCDQGLKKVRIWSAACSTGEEPYTIAMTTLPHLQKHKLDLKILATDISTRVLAHAKAGIYDEERLVQVPPELKARYFRPSYAAGAGKHEVVPPLKNLMMFRRLNFTVFPYPIKGVFDVIFCRNAMIYFDRDLRSRMVLEFARLLKPGGLLLIGHSETLIGMEKKYRTIKPSVYRRLNEEVDGDSITD